MQIAVDRIWTGWMPMYANISEIREFIICRIAHVWWKYCASCIYGANVLRQTIFPIDISDKCSLIEWMPNAINFGNEGTRKKKVEKQREDSLIIIIRGNRIIRPKCTHSTCIQENVIYNGFDKCINVPPLISTSQNPKSLCIFEKFPKCKQEIVQIEGK